MPLSRGRTSLQRTRWLRSGALVNAWSHDSRAFQARLSAAVVEVRASAARADRDHAHADSYVSLAVIASATVVALGAPIGDPLIGLAISVVILRITWQSWRTVRGHDHDH